MSKQITEDEKLALVGLITLGRQHYRMVDEVYEALTKRLGEDGTNIHDALYEQDALDIDDLLEKNNIEVI